MFCLNMQGFEVFSIDIAQRLRICVTACARRPRAMNCNMQERLAPNSSRAGKSACRTLAIQSRDPSPENGVQRSAATADGNVAAGTSSRQIMSNVQKVAIITGASQGIGAALVNAYRQRNYRVVATSRSIVQGDDKDILAVPGDIGDAATAERVVSEAIARLGRIDTLVNNAGIFIAKPFTEYSAKDFESKISTNLAGFFHITQRVATQMLKQGAGHIVSITTSLTDHAIAGVPSVLANLTKGGINSATKALAIEYAKQGIRVNAVSPGVIKTPMHAPETHEFLAALHPVKRMGDVGDIVDAVLYLESANFVTGEILHVDGGQSAGH
jgi:NAD(P)-dependent dehydrogenase (short-subunit alcohol dehydrogenase family)